MKLKNKEDLFEHVPVPRAVASLAIPTVAATLVMLIYNLADTFFVGMMNDPLETSAVTIAAPVLLAFNAVTNLFGVGCSSAMSRALGRRDYDKVKMSSAMGFYFAIICGLIISIGSVLFRSPLLHLLGASAENMTPTGDYLFWTVTCGAIPSILNVVMGNVVRAEGSATHASIGTMSGCILNIFLDPIFIMPWGLNMGASGAGCATFLSNCLACLYFIGFVILKKDHTYVTLKPSYFRFDKSLYRDVFGVGLPASIQNLLNVTGMTLLNNLMAKYGAEAVSAMGITHKVALVPLYVSMGIGQGIMPLVGYNFSSGNRKRMKEVILFTLHLALVIVVAGGAVFYLNAGRIISLFMTNATIVEYGGAFLRGAAIGIPFLGIDFLAVSIFQACGMGRASLIFAILRKVVLEIPALVLLDRWFPMYGMAYAQPVAEAVLAVVALIVLLKIMNGGEKDFTNAQSV